MDEIAFPARRVLPRAGDMLRCLSGIEDVFDPTTQPARRLGNLVPDRLENGENIVRGNRINRLHQQRLGVRLDCRSEEQTSALQSLMRISYAVFCMKKKKYNT